MAGQNTDGSKTAQHLADSSDDAKGKAKRCFIVSPIGADRSDVRERANDVRDYVIKPAVEPLGFTVERADDISNPGMIMQQVVEAIIDADLVIADLTDLNANVLYELAIRHETGKPVIMIAEDGTKIPFDINQARTIFFNHHNVRSVDACKKSISAQAESCLKGAYKPDNPIINAKNLSELRAAGGENADRDLAAMTITALNDFSTTVSGFGSRLRSLEASLERGEPTISSARLASLVERANDAGISLTEIPEFGSAWPMAQDGDRSAIRFLENSLRHLIMAKRETAAGQKRLLNPPDERDGQL